MLCCYSNVILHLFPIRSPLHLFRCSFFSILLASPSLITVTIQILANLYMFLNLTADHLTALRYTSVWCLRQPLANVFPGLYRRSTKKKGVVADNTVINGTGSLDWKLHLPVWLNNSEATGVPVLCNIMTCVELSEHSDVLEWRDGVSKFSVRTSCSRLATLRVSFLN